MHDETLIARLYRSMLLIRRVEEHIVKVYHTDVVKSPVHLSIGQESVAVGICDPLATDDIVSNTYRCHATYLAKGGDLKQMMAELYGKKDGCAGGKAGSMHLIDMPRGVMGASAVVGSTIPVAAGYALAMQREAKKTGRQRVTAIIFGDGATEEGVFSETINFAALHKLPAIFICENNELAIHTPLEKRWSTRHICERMKTYGLTTHKIDDADVFKIRDVVAEAAEQIRAGKSGPVFIECATYRWKEHVGPGDDHHEDYRDEAIYQSWKANDQIERLAKMLGPKTCAEIEQDIMQEIDEAERFALNSPFPNVEDLYTHVYA